jgi:hypothetical protein
MSLEVKPNSQSSQKSQYSQYTQGLVTGALATGAMIGGALAVNAVIRSGTPISSGMFNEITQNTGTLFFTGLAGVYGALWGGLNVYEFSTHLLYKNTNDYIKTIIPPIASVFAGIFNGAHCASSAALAGLVWLSITR